MDGWARLFVKINYLVVLSLYCKVWKIIESAKATFHLLIKISITPTLIMSTHRYVTVVPVYKTTPSKVEALSLMQLLQLEVKNVTLMCPEGLDIRVYLDLWPDLKVEFFDQAHFVNVQSYNDFLLQPPFYERFSKTYQWMLIYQLDAFIFSNQIEHFCDLGYDYYGAPWLSSFPQYRFLFNRWPIRINLKRFFVGNGGFSLRKLDSTITLLQRTQGHISQTFFMEDAFFGYWGSFNKSFHAAPPEVAALFSIETYPGHWLRLTNTFPMGTHNFQRSGKEWAKEFFSPTLKKQYEILSEAFPKLKNLKE